MIETTARLRRKRIRKIGQAVQVSIHPASIATSPSFMRYRSFLSFSLSSGDLLEKQPFKFLPVITQTRKKRASSQSTADKKTCEQEKETMRSKEI